MGVNFIDTINVLVKVPITEYHYEDEDPMPSTLEDIFCFEKEDKCLVEKKE